MDYSDTEWKPDEGDYLCMLEDYKKDILDKEGVKIATAKPVWKVYSECDFKDRTFADFFYMPPITDPGESLPFGVQNMMRMATCLANREIKDSVEADGINESAIGAFVSLRIYKTKAGKGPYIRYLSRVDEGAPQQPVEPTDG
jgi:hypothetical protein